MKHFLAIYHSSDTFISAFIILFFNEQTFSKKVTVIVIDGQVIVTVIIISKDAVL